MSVGRGSWELEALVEEVGEKLCEFRWDRTILPVTKMRRPRQVLSPVNKGKKV